MYAIQLTYYVYSFPFLFSTNRQRGHVFSGIFSNYILYVGVTFLILPNLFYVTSQCSLYPVLAVLRYTMISSC